MPQPKRGFRVQDAEIGCFLNESKTIGRMLRRLRLRSPQASIRWQTANFFRFLPKTGKKTATTSRFQARHGSGAEGSRKKLEFQASLTRSTQYGPGFIVPAHDIPGWKPDARLCLDCLRCHGYPVPC